MGELEWNKPLTVGRLKEELKDIPDHVHVNVLNEKRERTTNVFVWFEDLDSRQFVELMGFKPFYNMSQEEKKKCGD